MTDKYIPRLVWPKIKRAHGKVPLPYGYMPHFSNEKYSVIDPLYVEVLEKALFHIDFGMSFSAAAEFLTKETGKPITAQGISNIWWKMRGQDPNNDRAIELKRKKALKAPKTAREKAEIEARNKLAGARRSVKRQEQRLNSLTEDRSEASEDYVPSFLSPREPSATTTSASVLEELSENRARIAFQPNPGPQTAFLAASEQEVLYGGAAGGGKSFALLADPMRYFNNKNFNGLLVRRTNDELRELKWKSRELYGKLFPKAVWREKDSMWIFPSGAQFWMTYLERDEDVQRYQGQAFTYIAFDELTHWPTPFAWNYMRSRLRTASDEGTDDKLPVFMRATTNPGGPGHGWVKRMFIDPAPPNQAFAARDLETNEVLEWPENDPKGRSGPLFFRKFIPAYLSDNPYLYNDGQYEANLLSLTVNQRKQLLEGDWTVADGAAFPEWNVRIHTCAPFEIPKSWRRFRSCDFGYSTFSQRQGHYWSCYCYLDHASLCPPGMLL